jgi:hypothetical protein
MSARFGRAAVIASSGVTASAVAGPTLGAFMANRSAKLIISLAERSAGGR